MLHNDRKFFFTQIGISIYARVTRIWDPNDKCREIVANEHVYNNLKRDYADPNHNLKPVQPSSNFKYTVWTCWIQGYEKAPLLVRRCLDNMQNHRFSEYR